MGVIILPSTISGGYTPICNECGTPLCYDIDEYEYQTKKNFWDNWKCKDCNKFWRKARTNYKQSPKEQAVELLGGNNHG